LLIDDFLTDRLNAELQPGGCGSELVRATAEGSSSARLITQEMGPRHRMAGGYFTR